MPRIAALCALIAASIAADDAPQRTRRREFDASRFKFFRALRTSKTSLAYLDRIDFTPHCIIDVGANRGDWTRQMIEKYPKASILMMEANAENEKYWREDILANSHVETFTGILNSQEAEVDWWMVKPGRESTGDSMFREAVGGWYDNSKPVRRPSYTLDGVLRDKRYCQVDFLKLDVQGAELEVLKGGLETLKTVTVVLMEVPFFGIYNAGAPGFLQHVAFMRRHGFVPYDILTPERGEDTQVSVRSPIRKGKFPAKYLLQVDMVFVRASHVFERVDAAELSR